MGVISHILQMCYNQYIVSDNSYSGSDDRYAGCEDMSIVCVNVIALCDILKSGCHVIYIHVMSYILCLCYHTYNGDCMIIDAMIIDVIKCECDVMSCLKWM